MARYKPLSRSRKSSGTASGSPGTTSVGAATVRERPRPVPRTRAGGLWVALVGAALAVLLLLIFILQNDQQTDIYFFALDGQLPVGAALLLAGVLGVLAAGVPATVRILQLRRLAVRRDHPEVLVPVDTTDTSPDTGPAIDQRDPRPDATDTGPDVRSGPA